jgi:hypothetical protein
MEAALRPCGGGLHKSRISRIGVSDTSVTRLRLSQFAFPRNALMLFICTFNAIFELAPIVGELFGHFVHPAWHVATDCGLTITVSPTWNLCDITEHPQGWP